MRVSIHDWPTVSKLLDEALDLPRENRDTWLGQLSAEHAHYTALLRELLDNHARAETKDFLGTLPKLTEAANPASELQDAVVPGERVTVGPYRLLRELGRGGMGAVWLAERIDGLVKRLFALKLPHPALFNRHLAERFARERDILAGLTHPNIARLYDAGVTDDGQAFLALEYVEGVPITDNCDGKRLNIRKRLELFLQVLNAVQYAHSHLVVHRDLKPSNILVSAEGQVQLLDFGIAKLLTEGGAEETELTRVGGRALTPDYAAPEQFSGQPVSTASDVYSLGVVLYELLTGERPYKPKRNSPGALEEAILAANPRSPSHVVTDPAKAEQRGSTPKKLAHTLAGDLDTIILKALKKLPAERYPTVNAFADDLMHYLRGEVVQAQPDSKWYRSKKFVARNKVVVGSAAAIMVALAGGLGAALWEAQVAREQAQRAEQVKAFILSIFSNADPDAGGKRATTSVDLLLQARGRIDATLGDKPEIAVELMSSIGYSLLGLGETEAAIPIFKEAVERASVQLPVDDIQALRAQLNYGEALLTAGHLSDAEGPLQHALAGMRRIDDSKGLIDALRWLSRLRREQRHNEVALELAREAAKLAQTKLGREDRDIALRAHLELLGAMQIARQPGLLAPSQRAYELAQSLYGNQLVRPLLVAREFYGTALVAEGDAERGVNLLKEAFTESKNLFGSTHPMVAIFGGRLGVGQLRVGDIAGAIETFGVARAIWDKTSGDTATPDRGFGHFYLGRAFAAAQRYDQAVTELSVATDIFDRAAGAEYPVTRAARSAYALALAHTGAFRAANIEFNKLLAVESREPYDAVVLKLRLGIMRQLEGQLDESEHLLRQAADTFGGPVFDRAERANALAALGTTLVEVGRYDSAIVEIERALEIYRPLQPRLSPACADALVAQGRAQMALGRTNDAVVSFGEAVRYWSDFGANTRGAGLAFLWYARALNATGQRRAAAEALARAGPIVTVSPFESDKSSLAMVQRELVLQVGHTPLEGAK